MTLIKFPEQTHVIAGDQPEYLPMPAFAYANDPEHKIVCCWKLNWRERVRLLFTGKLWHSVLTFGGPLQPQLLQVTRPFNAKDVLMAQVAKKAADEREAWLKTMIEKYGKKCVGINLRMDARGYHKNDRRRMIEMAPEDFARAKELGMLHLMGCRIVDAEQKSAV